MKKCFLFLFVFVANSLMAQNMTNAKLQSIIHQESDSIYSSKINYCEFQKIDVKMICLTDSIANRMRIISPISKIENLSPENIVASLAANFHTALDVKYAVSNGIMWSIYIHPLKELSSSQIKDALVQVYNANVTFGVSYQSTGLVFGELDNKTEEIENEKKKLKKI